MGKFKPRAKPTKGKRWKKGDSCVSNPQNTKHRDAAKSNFFQENLGRAPTARSSLLTCDAVQKHDIILNSEAAMPMDEVQSESGCSVKTFASDWTNCTNKTFGRLLKGFEPSSAHHKEMLAVLAAVTTVIKDQGGTETSLEYFGVLMTALDIEGSEENTSAIVSLLKMAIRGVPQNILRLKFEELGQTFSSLLNKYSESENSSLLCGAIDCLAAMLRAQDVSDWNQSKTLDYFSLLLVFTIHSKPRVRKGAQFHVAAILKVKLANKTVHPAASSAGDFCVLQLEGPTGNVASSGITTVLHTLGFLKSILATFPRAQIKSCCESILKVMTLGDPRITICGLQALHGLMIMRPSTSNFTPDLNARLISALFDFKPENNDKTVILTWLTVMQEAYSSLAESDHKLCLSNVPRFAKQVGALLEEDHVDILSGAALAMKTVVYDCLSQRDNAVSLPQMEQSINHTLKVMNNCLRSQCHAAWKYVVHIFGALYQVAGDQFPTLLTPSLKKLSMMREEQLLALGPHIDKAVGLAVHTMGPKILLEALPLEINFEEQNSEFSNSWLLPVLRENIHRAELLYFVNNIYPLASKCKKKSEELTQIKANAAAHGFRLFYLQLWSLLPGFCNDPTDFETGMKGIAKLLGIALNEKDIRIDVMAGLRKLVACSLARESETPRNTLANYSKNYLPILFSIYTTAPENSLEEGQRLAALETVKSYLKITNPELTHSLFDRAYEKLSSLEPPKTDKKKKKKDAKKEEEFKVRDAVLQLLMTLVSYQNNERVSKMFNICCSLLKSQNHKEQKRGYRLLEELCRSDNPACKEFIKQNLPTILQELSAALVVAKPPSRASRLRCLLLLVDLLEPQHETFLNALVPEAILCCKDINEKCRSAAYALLLQIGKTLQRLTNDPAEAVVRKYLSIILPGLQGSVNLISATVLALTTLLHSYGDLLPPDIIALMIFNVSSLLSCNTREIVGPCLSFFKAFLSTFSTEICGPHVEAIMNSLVQMNDDCTRHFRMKTRELLVRLVRRYGMSLVSSFVPENDEIMHKRLKNIGKELDRKARDRKERLNNEDTDDDVDDMNQDFETISKLKSIEEILADSDEDLDSDNGGEQPNEAKSKYKKMNAWIHEKSDAVLDFTDPTATRKIIATDPKSIESKITAATTNKNRGFKTTPDGRLIIKEDSDSEEETPKSKKRKADITIESDDDIEDEGISENDNERPAGCFVLAPGSKRRRALSSSTDALSESSMKYKAGGSGIHRPCKPKQKAEASPSHFGLEYRAKKARGDVKKKGKPDPYAYIPLNSKMLNKRKRAKHSGQLKRLETSAKKGVMRGKNARAKMLNKKHRR